jgi:hypothetical protein
MGIFFCLTRNNGILIHYSKQTTSHTTLCARTGMSIKQNAGAVWRLFNFKAELPVMTFNHVDFYTAGGFRKLFNQGNIMRKKSNLRRFLVLVSTLFILTTQANTDSAFWPGVQYDPQIPTFKQVLGYETGERITNHSDMLQFFTTLQQAAPDRIKLVEYARSWEGRKLIYAVVGNPTNIAALDEFAANMQKLADPRLTNTTAAKKMMQQLPASVWLQYGVHGNEISSTDAAMLTAYHLLAAPQDQINQQILTNTLVFIDPLQNPDGRERFTSRYYATVGLKPSDDRLSAEHNEPWPNGRSNHYLFDMNRDWLAQTQPETQGRIKLLNHFKPLVVIDLHEMESDYSYYFAPAAQPYNPHMTATQLANLALIGKNNGRHFDRFGFDYFTREIFDSFYPGYGDSWPTFYGALASTYELGSTRGEIFRRSNGQVLTYRDTVQQHFITSISTAEAVANHRVKLLNDFYTYQVSAIEAGESDRKERVFIMPNQRDRAANHRLATLMARHGVEVFQAQSDFKACGKKYDAGAYYIDTAQPRGRFVKTTFTRQVDMDAQFVEEQERRRSRKLDNEIYDVTGWSLPLMFNVDSDACGSSVKVASETINGNSTLLGQVKNLQAKVAYLVPWGDMAAGRFLTAALQQGVTLKSADEAFRLADKTHYPAGTLIIEKRNNKDNLSDTMTRLALQTGAVVDGVDSSWVSDGPSFGSARVMTLSAPKIAIAWDEPVSSLSAGNTRFVIERQFNYPVTAIRTQQLVDADLSAYDVLILPTGDHQAYKKTLGEAGASNLKAWVQRGGVLITLGNATRFAIDSQVDLLDVKLENAYRDADKEKKPAKKTVTDEAPETTKGTILSDKKALVNAIENTEEQPDIVAGVLVNVDVDQEHWLTAGVHPQVVAMVSGNSIYAPIKLGSGKNLAWFSDEKTVLASGYLWAENQRQLAYKPFLIHQPMERGMVISFTQEPTTRAYLDGLNLLLMNSIFRAAAHAKMVR